MTNKKYITTASFKKPYMYRGMLGRLGRIVKRRRVSRDKRWASIK